MVMSLSELSTRPETSDRDAFDGRTVLVTGGLGFIGSTLVMHLKRVGAEVHTVSRRPLESGGEGRHWRADLSDPDAALRVVRAVKPHFVFHLASHVMGAPDLHHVLPTFQSNLQTTVNLLIPLAEVGCGRMIITGSLVEPESGARAIPNSPYAVAKWAASDYARMFHAVYRFPVAIARVFMVYGPGQQDESKLVPYVIRCVLRGEAPKITSGTHRIDWIFVEDVVSGLMKLAVASDVEGKSVDLGSGILIPTKDLVDKICMFMTAKVKPAYGALADRPFEPIRVADTQEALRLIGWSPRIQLTDGLRRTIDWYSAMPSEIMDWRGAARNRGAFSSETK
jgi:nucleoside-diphosphate-sugar epimerase